MAIAFVNASNATANAAPLVVTAPASIVAGNLLIAVVYAAIQTATAIAPPSGWTSSGVSTPNTVAGGMAVFIKVATASEPANYTFTGPNFLAGVILQYSGATGLDGSPSFNPTAAGSTTLTANSVTPTSATDTWVTGFGSFNGQNITTPSGQTARANARSAGNESCFVFDQILSSSAPTGSITATQLVATGYNSVSFLLTAGTSGSTGLNSGGLGSGGLGSGGLH